MGSQRMLNRSLKKREKEKIAERPDMKIFQKLQTFYKDHPHATHAVKNEVDLIRQEFDQATDDLQKKYKTL